MHKHECNSSLGLEIVSECQIFCSAQPARHLSYYDHLMLSDFFFFWKNMWKKKEGEKYVPFQPEQTSPRYLSAALPLDWQPQLLIGCRETGERMPFIRTLGKWACLNVTIFLMVIITPCMTHLEQFNWAWPISWEIIWKICALPFSARGWWTRQWVSQSTLSEPVTCWPITERGSLSSKVDPLLSLLGSWSFMQQTRKLYIGWKSGLGCFSHFQFSWLPWCKIHEFTLKSFNFSFFWNSRMFGPTGLPFSYENSWLESGGNTHI